MISSHEAIREVRERGTAVVVPARYSPNWWDVDRSKPSVLRQQAYKWRPRLTVIVDGDGPRQFIAFGDADGVLAAMDDVLGPIVANHH